MNAEFHGPCEPEQAQRDEHGADVGQREPELWLWLAVVALGEGVVD